MMKLNLKQAFPAIVCISSLSFVAPAALSQVPQVGIKFKGESSGLNQAQATAIQVVGDCPSEVIAKIKAYFVSSDYPPAKGRRVVIRNVTEGVNLSKAPYTERKYDKGSVSQGITMAPEYDHSGTSLAFIPNKVNTFEFEILENKQIVAHGSFSAVINVNTKTVERHIDGEPERYCLDTNNTNMQGCQNPGTREKGYCPPDNTSFIPYVKYRYGSYLNDQNQNETNQDQNETDQNQNETDQNQNETDQNQNETTQ